MLGSNEGAKFYFFIFFINHKIYHGLLKSLNVVLECEETNTQKKPPTILGLHLLRGRFKNKKTFYEKFKI